MNKLLTAEELALLLGIGAPQVRKLTRENSIPHHRVGGAIRYDYEAVKTATITNGKTERYREVIPAPITLKALMVSDSDEFHLIDLAWCIVDVYEDDPDSVDMRFVSTNGTIWDEAVDTSTNRVLGPDVPHTPSLTLGDWATSRGLKAAKV